MTEGTRSTATRTDQPIARGWMRMPAVGPRYWAALCVASVLGADTGDILSRPLGLGYWHGLPPLAALFALVVLAARRGPGSEAYYWIGVLVVRTAATNLADLQTLVLGSPMPVTAAAFGVVLIAAAFRRRSADAGPVLVADARFWIAMLAAGTVGTALGDDLAFGQGLGPAFAAAVSTVLLAIAFAWRATSRASPVPTFWVTVVAVRTWGTNVGDMTADRCGLLRTAAIVLVLFVALLLAWRPERSPPEARIAA